MRYAFLVYERPSWTHAYHDSMFELVKGSCLRLGFRGRFLLLVGSAYLAQGVASIDTWELAPHDLAPPWARSALWVVAGLLAIVTAWRPLQSTNPLGWTALYVPPAVWSLSYLIGWIGALAPQLGVPYSYRGGLTYAATWALVVAVIMICADWPEPPPRRVLPSDPSHDHGSDPGSPTTGQPE